jgi:cell division protein YceG involved in septum cleavage
MKRFHTPSILLGMGLGLLLTALMGVVFFSFLTPEPSDAEIVDRATSLGMRMPQAEAGMVRLGDGTAELFIREGETLSALAQRLEREDVLDNSLEFQVLARQAGLADTPPPGRYEVLLPCSAKDLVRILAAGPKDSGQGEEG